MNNFFGSNVRVLRERKKRSQQEMAELFGLTRSVLNNYEHGLSNPSIDNLMNISEYINININTLLSVDFRKLSAKQLNELEMGLDVYVKGSRLRILATTVNDKNEDNVELVSVKAKAGYATGYGDPEFVSKLPAYQFPFLPKDKKHRAFQISGDSMLPIPDRSWIACHYLEDWNDIQNGQGYVIVTKDEGVVFKRAYNRIKQDGTLLLVSMNSIYQPYEIQISEVLEVWKFSLKFSSEMMEG
ncbi:MAG: helix-turn-helix domain-containing protein [Bacteroidetes bacterium]|nr:helix-turn-helix domain-containing protein [Bacteroidota bacterium]